LCVRIGIMDFLKTILLFMTVYIGVYLVGFCLIVGTLFLVFLGVDAIITS